MSEVTTSGDATEAPAETASAPAAAPVPTFGTSRGSGLARGKRASASTPAATKDAAQGDYQPTAIQVVNHQREYKNPFAPEPAIPAEAPVAAVPAAVTPVTAPVAVEPAPKPVESIPEEKAELKILPPEEKPRPAQSWELNSQEKPAEENQAPRQSNRSEFRNDRREREGRYEQRGEFRPRERREPRTFEPKPTPAVAAEAKKPGLFGWLKRLFSGDEKEQKQALPNQHQEENVDNRRQDENRGGRNHRGGRNRGFRGENRGPQFGSNQEGQGDHSQGGDRRFDGHRGGGRRHHRGGRGRFRGDSRGGEHRSDSGPAS